jgi:hypothetical protein
VRAVTKRVCHASDEIGQSPVAAASDATGECVANAGGCPEALMSQQTPGTGADPSLIGQAGPVIPRDSRVFPSLLFRNRVCPIHAEPRQDQDRTKTEPRRWFCRKEKQLVMKRRGYLLKAVVLLFLIPSCSQFQSERISGMPYPELTAFKERVPVTLAFGTFSDERTVQRNEFRGWWRTFGRVPVEMHEFRLHISKLVTRQKVFDRVMILDKTKYPSYRTEVDEAKARGADILIRCRLSSLEFTSTFDGWWGVPGAIATAPIGVAIAAANGGALLIMAIGGKLDDVVEEMRWVWIGDMATPCVIGRIKPLVYVEIVDVSTGQQLSESSIEWHASKNSFPILYYSEWISKARNLLDDVYDPLSKDIARTIAGEVTSMLRGHRKAVSSGGASVLKLESEVSRSNRQAGSGFKEN